MEVGPLQITLSAERRRSFNAALWALTFACAAVSLVSYRLADWLSDKGMSALVRFGMRVVVK